MTELTIREAAEANGGSVTMTLVDPDGRDTDQAVTVMTTAHLRRLLIFRPLNSLPVDATAFRDLEGQTCRPQKN